MPLTIVRNDITKMAVDAIVNAANSSLLGGGGVDGAIHKAAGPGLLKECRTLGGCRTGEAKLTGGYDLPCRYVIHTVGPVWQGGSQNEPALLASCYRESMRLAAEKDCRSIAFPLISSGIYGYPKAEALRIAVDTIGACLRETEDEPEVFLVVFGRESFRISESLYSDIQSFIDDRYAEAHHDDRRRPAYNMPMAAAAEPAPQQKQKSGLGCLFGRKTADDALMEDACYEVPSSLGRALEAMDESFSQMLLRMIDERGMTDAQCYKKANIDRKLFSKIRSDVHYRPKKVTVIAFALALELSLDETKDMLMKAGYALSHSSRFDIIVEYFISHGRYDVYEINEALFAFDQPLIGAAAG